MKKRTVAAKRVLVFPEAGFSVNAYWRVRISLPTVPFAMDSRMRYLQKADADRIAERWRKRKITLTIEDAE